LAENIHTIKNTEALSQSRRQVALNSVYVYVSPPEREVKISLCLTKHHNMRTYEGSGGIAPCIHYLGTRWK
jgi:hypothetical protein